MCIGGTAQLIYKICISNIFHVSMATKPSLEMSYTYIATNSQNEYGHLLRRCHEHSFDMTLYTYIMLLYSTSSILLVVILVIMITNLLITTEHEWVKRDSFTG